VSTKASRKRARKGKEKSDEELNELLGSVGIGPVEPHTEVSDEACFRMSKKMKNARKKKNVQRRT
jgi:hypothetical protein